MLCWVQASRCRGGLTAESLSLQMCCLSPPEGVSCLRLKTKDERREDSAPPTLRRRLGKIHPPTPSSGNWSCRHFCPHTYPERDFYPSTFRVFFTLFDAILICICQCTWPHKIPTFSRGPLIFAPARHQSATQTAPKPAPKLRAFSRVLHIFVSAQHQSAPQTAPTLRAFSPIRA